MASTAPRGRGRRRPMSEINVVPYIDVMLVLLVIFMVTAPMMVKTTMDLKLPSAENTDEIKKDTFSVTILKSGNVMLLGKLISADDLKLEVKKAVQKNPTVQVLMEADKMATHGMVIELIDVVKAAGATNFAFQVEKKKNEE